MISLDTEASVYFLRTGIDLEMELVLVVIL